MKNFTPIKKLTIFILVICQFDQLFAKFYQLFAIWP